MNSRYRQFRHRARLLLAETLNAVQHGLLSNSAEQSASPEMMPLEQRILMSASPAAAAVASPDLAPATVEPLATSAEMTEPVAAEPHVEAFADEESQTKADSPIEADAQIRIELVVIDPSVDAYEQLINDLQGQTGRRFEILILNPRDDGIGQISDVLRDLNNVSAVHLISHGDEGEILLGTSVLSQRSLDRYVAELLTWQQALTEDADLLIYGCDLAGDESGVELSQSLSVLLGADVASSVDDTGHTSLGGDWQLEHIDGQIEATVAFSSKVQDEWTGLLGAPELTDTDEFRVNSTHDQIQETSADERGSQQAIALAADGSYVVVWSAINQDGSGWGVYARRIDSSGTALTSEIQVAQTTTDNQQWARVASDASGSFVVTWTGTNQDGTPQSIYARRFDSAGSPLGSEFRVHGTSTGIQKNSSIAMSGDGSFIVVWEGAGPGDADGIHAQRFDAVGATIGTEFTVNSTTAGIQGDAAVAMNSAGQFVVTWDSGAGVVARAFNENGIAQTADVMIDSSASAARPSVAMNSGGDFVVVWNRDTTGFGTGVFVRAYGLTGTSLTAEASVNTYVLGDQLNASVSMDTSGNYLVAWEGQGFSDFEGVQFQRFASDHSRIAGEARAASTTVGNQHMASAAMQDVNHFVLVWSGKGTQPGSNDNDGVFARQFALASPVIDLDANDSSGATLANFTTHYYDGGGPVTLADTDAVLTDADDTHLALLTVTITNRQDSAAEQLAADTSGTSLSANFNSILGTLTVFGAAPVSDYEQVLRTMTYNNQSGTATGASRSIRFVASDGLSSSNVATSSVLLNVPTGQLWLSTKGDGAATGQVWSNDEIITFGNSGDLFEPENGTTSGTLSQLPGFAAGVDIRGLHYVQTDITLGTTTQFTLQSGDVITALNDTFTFNASDGDNGNDFSAGRKDLVVFRPDTAGDYSAGEWFMLLEEGVQRNGKSSNVHAIALVEADTTVGGTQLPRGTFLVAFSGPSEHNNLATFTVNETGFLATRSTTDTVDLLLGDPLGNNDDQIQGVHLLHQTTDFGSTTLPAGTLLVQIKDSGTYAGVAHNEFDVMAVTVTQTEQDAISGSAATGTLLFDGSDLQLDAPLNESLTGLTVVISTPQMSNQAPIATAGGPYTITEGSSLTIDAGGSSDPDGDPLTFAWDLDHDRNFGEIGEPVTAGEGVSWSTLQSFGIDDNGSYTIGVQVNDGRGGVDEATATLTVNNVAPMVTSSASISVPENMIMVQSVTATDPVDTLTFAIVGGQDAARFSLNSTSGELSFLDAPDFEAPTDVGSDNSYEVLVEVSDGVQADSQAIVVTIGDLNDETPTIASGQSFSVLETAANGTSLGTVITSDTDAGTTFSNWTITGGNPDGVFAINSTTGELTVVDRTSLDFETTQSYLLSVTVSDGSHTSAVQTVAITVGNTNDTAPVAVADNYSLNEGAALNRPKGTGVLANDFDVDGDVITATLISGPEHADTFTFRADGSFRYRHDGSETGSDSFVYAVSDGTNSTTAVVNLTINSENDGPTISLIPNVTTPEDTATGPITISVDDPDTPLNQLALSATSANQSLIPDSGLLLSGSGANRTLTITPAQNAFGGPVMILVSVSDGTITSSTSFQVVVTPVNDAPVVAPAVVHQYAVTSNAAATVASPALLTGATDVDGDPLAIAVVTGPLNGSLAVHSNGSFTYEANTGFLGMDTFTFAVTDGDLSSNQKQVTLQVTSPSPVENVVAPAQTTVQDTAPAADADASPTDSSPALQESLPPIVAAAASSRETLAEDSEEISAAAVRQQQDDDSPVLFILSSDMTSGNSTEVSLSGQVISAAYTDRVEVSAFETLSEARTGHDTDGDRDGNRNPPGAQAIETLSFERYAELKGTAEHVAAFSDNLQSEYSLSDMTTDSVVVVGSSVVIGTVVTALRTGMLALGLLSQLPVWTMFDPLMVVDGVTGEEDGDSLEDIVDRQTEKNEESEQTSQRN